MFEDGKDLAWVEFFSSKEKCFFFKSKQREVFFLNQNKEKCFVFFGNIEVIEGQFFCFWESLKASFFFFLRIAF